MIEEIKEIIEELPMKQMLIIAGIYNIAIVILSIIIL